jgi:diacylglycerol kinase
MRTQNSFWVHLSVAAAVVVTGVWLRLELWRWVAIALAITFVLSAELINSAIEQLVQALHPEHDDRIGRALDIAAGSVLLAAIGSVAVGLMTLGSPLWTALFG